MLYPTSRSSRNRSSIRRKQNRPKGVNRRDRSNTNSGSNRRDRPNTDSGSTRGVGSIPIQINRLVPEIGLTTLEVRPETLAEDLSINEWLAHYGHNNHGLRKIRRDTPRSRITDIGSYNARINTPHYLRNIRTTLPT